MSCNSSVALSEQLKSTTFDFHTHPVRVVTEGGVDLFIAADVTKILGYSKARFAVRTHVAKRDRSRVRNPHPTSQGGNPYLVAVTESGVYALAFGSRKPEALEFKRWVTSEVLPALRKTGRYEITSQVPALLEQVGKMLRGRGAAKGRQCNRIIAHRNGSFSYRIGKHWVHRVPPIASELPLAHGLREGVALRTLVGNLRQTQLGH
jgi:prophage antirepressor-like protein